MRNLPAGVFGPLYGPGRKEGGLIIPARPDVVRNLRYRRGNKKGLMWIHGPKGNHQMCQTVADALFLPDNILHFILHEKYDCLKDSVSL